MAEHAFVRPLREADFADQLGLVPTWRVRLFSESCRAGSCRRPAGASRSFMSRSILSLKPVPTWPQCTRRPSSWTGEDERAELVDAPAAARRVPGDDARLASPGLDLHPLGCAHSGAIERVRALADDALDAGLARFLEECDAVALDVLGEEDVRRVDDRLAQRLLANAQLGGEQSRPSSCSRSNAMNVTGCSAAMRRASLSRPTLMRCCRRSNEGRPSASRTTSSPSTTA